MEKINRKDREVVLRCNMLDCKKEFVVMVPWGCFIESESAPAQFGKIGKVHNYRMEIYRERMSRPDILIEEVVCPRCGCCRSLEFVDKNNEGEKNEKA